MRAAISTICCRCPIRPRRLDRVSHHVAQVQDALGTRMLLENPSTYLLFEDSSIDEIDFLEAIAERTGCGLLLDVNNVMVSAINHRLDPFDYIRRFPMNKVGEIHLAGYDDARRRSRRNDWPSTPMLQQFGPMSSNCTNSHLVLPAPCRRWSSGTMTCPTSRP